MVPSGGVSVVASFRVMAPAVLVISRPVIGRGSMTGIAGGSWTGSLPMASRAQLILVNIWNPVSGPLCPSVGLLRMLAAAVIQAACWGSVRPRQERAWEARLER